MARAFARILILIGLVACATPTLPLPPPSLPESTVLDNGTVRLHSTGGVEANAIVILYNHNSLVSLADRVSGVEADDNGSWDKTLVAAPGDEIEIYQEYATTRSPSVSLVIRK